MTDIHPNPNQPRKIFKEKELKELSDSIKQNGIIQPLLLLKQKKVLSLIAGERRLRAAKTYGLDKVPVKLRSLLIERKMVVSIIENVQRSDLNCVEEALAYYQLMNEFNLNSRRGCKEAW